MKYIFKNAYFGVKILKVSLSDEQLKARLGILACSLEHFPRGRDVFDSRHKSYVVDPHQSRIGGWIILQELLVDLVAFRIVFT